MWDEIHRWIPAGASLASAQQIMEQHQYVCSTVSYDNVDSITNNPCAVEWTKDFVRSHASKAVTNITVLDCDKPNDRHTQLLVINGKMYQLLRWGDTTSK